jgi:hypothetical protein
MFNSSKPCGGKGGGGMPAGMLRDVSGFVSSQTLVSYVHEREGAWGRRHGVGKRHGIAVSGVKNCLIYLDFTLHAHARCSRAVRGGGRGLGSIWAKAANDAH